MKSPPATPDRDSAVTRWLRSKGADRFCTAATILALEQSWHLVVSDQAGFGRTPLPSGSRGGLQLWTEQAAALMDTLGIRSYAVVGHSMGGAVALALAAARPQQVTRVVAVSTMGAPGAPLSPGSTPSGPRTPGCRAPTTR